MIGRILCWLGYHQWHKGRVTDKHMRRVSWYSICLRPQCKALKFWER
jgi:hypothetical protein